MKTKKQLNIEFFKNFNNYIAKIDLRDDMLIDSNEAKVDFSTVIILDKSDSMYDSIDKITKIFLPEFFQKLNYNDNQNITFITFGNSNDSEILTYSFSEIKGGINIDANGATYMCDALKLLKNYLENMNQNKNVRILTISDGELHDQEETVNFSQEIVNLIKLKNLNVNSQAIRFFSSSMEPDTRVLSSCLQFSNVTTPKLIDIYANNYQFLNYDEIFKSDGFINRIVIESNENCLQSEPWEEMKNNLDLFLGTNTFWVSKNFGEKLLNNQEKLKIKDKEDEYEINIILKEDISINNYKDIISNKIKFYFKKLKVLKILNSQKSLEEMDKIIQYFSNFENQLFCKQEVNILDNSLNSRLILISKQIEKRKISLSNKMGEIRNDEKIMQLNSRQQAEYLRKMDINDKTSKALAKRAFNQGFEFDEIAKKEIIKMSEHLDELKEIDSSILHESFYSTCNTLDGIKIIQIL